MTRQNVTEKNANKSAVGRRMTPAMSTADVARKLGKDRRTIKQWTEAGRLPVWFTDDNGRPVYSESTIAAHQRRAGELAAERQAAA